MAGYGEPDWVSSPQQSNTTSAIVADANLDSNVAAGLSPSATGGNQGIKSNGGCFLCLLSIMNIGLAAMMTALGVLTIIQVHLTGLGDLSEPFLAAYMVLFAVLLFIYELMWWSPAKKLNKNMRKKFRVYVWPPWKGFVFDFCCVPLFRVG